MGTILKPPSAGTSVRIGRSVGKSSWAADWCGRKPDDPSPIVYQGCHKSDAETLLKGGINSYCLSYYDIERGNGNYLMRHPGFTDRTTRSFLDSGAFSFLVMGQNASMSEAEMEKKVEAYVANYSAWVKKYGERFDFHITFDYRVSAEVTFRMTQRLQKMGIRPTPVYHGDSSISWLMKYIDLGFPLICLSKRFFLNDRKGLLTFYDQVFNLTEKHGVALHGLACTGNEAWRYPWWSVDSTSLVKDAGNGILRYWDSHGVHRGVSVSRNCGARSIGKELLDLMASCNMTPLELAEERTKRVLFNAIMLKRFLDSRKAKTWNRKTLF